MVMAMSREVKRSLVGYAESRHCKVRFGNALVWYSLALLGNVVAGQGGAEFCRCAIRYGKCDAG